MEVDDLITAEQIANEETEFQTFKKEMEGCIGAWKKVIDKPLKNISSLISQKHSTTEIGTLEFN